MFCGFCLKLSQTLKNFTHIFQVGYMGNGCVWIMDRDRKTKWSRFLRNFSTYKFFLLLLPFISITALLINAMVVVVSLYDCL